MLVFWFLILFVSSAQSDLIIPLFGGNLVIRNNSDGSLTFSTDQNLNINGNGAGRNTSLTVGGKNGGVIVLNDTAAVMVDGKSHGINTSLDTTQNNNKKQSPINSLFGFLRGF